jgi:branched-subunit amino acid aminotransferase/4-amino-4-deoxychorismate lyase
MLEQLKAAGYSVAETAITPSALYDADEIFLTNAASGIRPVTSCGGSSLNVHFSQTIIDQVLKHF